MAKGLFKCPVSRAVVVMRWHKNRLRHHQTIKLDYCMGCGQAHALPVTEVFGGAQTGDDNRNDESTTIASGN